MKKRNVKKKEDTTDRISELPDCIIENILLRLRLSHPRVRVRVSVLSKRFFALSASLPMLEFDSSDFWNENYIYCSNPKDSFYKYVEHTVSRFCRQQNVMNAHTFKLCTVSVTDAELKIIDACLELILLKRVELLEIEVFRSTYRLPDILTSAFSLISLKVCYCMLPSSLMVDVANFKSLKVLQLRYVCLDDPLVIKHLTASCPLLEELIIRLCYGKKCRVYGRLPNLKKAHFLYNNHFEIIDIEAPNLREFELCLGHMEGIGETYLNLGLCKRLKTLRMCGPFFPTSTALSEFLSNYSILENLSLCLSDRCKILEISSPSLRKFELYDKCDLEYIDFIAPNLLLFSYANGRNYYKPNNLFNFDPGESIACMECLIINDVDTLWFQKLRRFLGKSDRFKVLNLDNTCRKISVDFEQLKVIQLAPYELEHVMVTLAKWKTKYLSFVDAILWCCHPRSLSLTSVFSYISDKERSAILKYISAKLIQQEDQSITNNIRIEWSIPSISKAKIYDSWNSMVPDLLYHDKQTLTFIRNN